VLSRELQRITATAQKEGEKLPVIRSRDTRGLKKLRAFPLWKAHQLTGDRKGVWSLHVTRNWRLTFRIKDGEISDVDYEDYH